MEEKMSAEKPMKEPQKSRKRLTIVFIVSLILTVVLGCFFVLFSFRGFVDFPCFVEVDNGEVISHGYDEIITSNHAVLFITTYQAHWSGGGCLIKELEDGGSATVGDYQIQVDGDVLTINGESELRPGETFEDSKKYLDFNPWYWYEKKLNLTSHGLVYSMLSSENEHLKLDQGVVIAIGSSGSRENLNLITAGIFGLSLLGTIVLGPYLFIQWIRTKRENKA
jgi:hypothetical protein